jgi:hypothetical protein
VKGSDPSASEKSAVRETHPRSGRKSGIVTPHPPKWFHRLGAALAFGIEQALTATLRPVWNDESGVFKPAMPPEPVIFCIWHNRLAMAMWMYRKRALKTQPGRRMAALVSASKDGAFLAAILESFGVRPVRGSSSRRGSQALLELTGWAEQGCDLAITPDGPRGPRYVIQDGVISVAQLTGLPIVPVGCWIKRKWTLKSWDAFQIPHPFSPCEITVAQPVHVPRELSDEERRRVRLDLEARMKTISRD